MALANKAEPGWCGCPGGPLAGKSQPRLSDAHAVEIPEAGFLYSISDVESISLTFHRPVEERFAVTSAELKIR